MFHFDAHRKIYHVPTVLQDWSDFQKHKGDMDFVVNVQIPSNNSYTNARVIREVFRVTVEAEGTSTSCSCFLSGSTSGIM